MNQPLFAIPETIFSIQKSLLNRDWFIHPFQLSKTEHAYDAANFLHQTTTVGTQYTFYLDLNVYQYILNAHKKNESNQLQRDGIGLLLFGRFIDAMFDPTYAVYEKLKYSSECPPEILDDLSLFRTLDDLPTDTLIDFYDGRTDKINIDEFVFIDKKYLAEKLTEFQRLKNWDTFYLHILAIVSINLEKISHADKLRRYILWSSHDFIKSLVCLAFAINTFSKNPLPSIIKFRENSDCESKKKALVNMTWDIYFMDAFFREWMNKEEDQEFIFVSNDNALKSTLFCAIELQHSEDIGLIRERMSNENYELLCNYNIEGSLKSFSSDFGAYRQRMIEKYETTLF